MTHRSHIPCALLLAASCLAGAACSHDQTNTGDLLFIPQGTTSGGIGAKLDPPQSLATRRSTSLGSIVDPGAVVTNGSAGANPSGTVTVITAPPAPAAAPAGASPASSPVVVGTVNSNYGAYTGRNVVASAGVITH